MSTFALTKKKFEPPATDINLPPEFVERLMFKKFLTDRSYTSFIHENFHAEHFETEVIKQAMLCGNAYYKKYKQSPSIDIVCKIMEAAGKVDESRMAPSYLVIPSEPDDDFTRDSIKRYIQSKSLFSLIFGNAESIMRDRNVAPYIDELKRIMSLDFYSDLGFNYFNQIEEHIFDLTNPEARISTGYDELDRITNGGFPKDGKCLIVIMAQTGLGKSMFMHNIVTNMLLAGKRVLIFSMEMTEQIYSRRISANIVGRNVNELGTMENISSIREAVAKIKGMHPDANLVIKEFPPSTISVNTMYNFAMQLKAQGQEFDLIVPDYLNLIRPIHATPGANSYERVGDVSKEMRAMSYMLGVPVLTATQTNRSGVDTTDPSVNNISDSSQIGFGADYIGSLVSQGLESGGVIDLVTLKNRFGGHVGHRIPFQVDHSTLRMFQIRRPVAENPAVDSIVNDISNF